jgi:hypothetical protein
MPLKPGQTEHRAELGELGKNDEMATMRAGDANKKPAEHVNNHVHPSEEATMTVGHLPIGLQLTEEEAFALLGLCMTSPQRLDVISEKALNKLAIFCKSRHLDPSNHKMPAQCELDEAG